jgi:putative MATE family efflux protein
VRILRRMDNSRELGERPIASLLLRFSIPAVVGMLVQALYNVVDRIFIGNGVGPLALAGVAVSFPLMLIAIAFAVLISIGATSLISISLGEGRRDRAETALGNGFVLLLAAAVATSVLGLLFLEPLLRVFGASDEVLPYAVDFMRIVLPAQIFGNISFGVNNFVRGEGNPRRAMTTMLLGAGANFVLNPLFIFVLHMGIRGSALATVVSQALSSAWVLSYYASGRSALALRARNCRLDRGIVLRILSIGAVPFSMQMAASLLNAALNNQLVAYGGDLAVSARGIIYTVDVLVFMVVVGINQGSQPIIGFNHGAGKPARVRQAFALSLVAATTVALLVWVATRLAPHAIVAVFGRDDPALSDLAARGLTLTFLLLPAVGIQMPVGNYFMAVGRPGRAVVLTLSRQLLVIPAAFVLPRFFGLDGVFAAMPAADTVALLLALALLGAEWRALRAREGAGAEAAEALEGAATPCTPPRVPTRLAQE